jgi:hypothetical protein
MTNLITPPPELVQQWYDKAFQNPTGAWSQQVAKAAAQWGADQELEACCALMDDWGLEASDLRAARRPKPPSLKEQALQALRQVGNCEEIDNVTFETIRRALEALPE